MDYINNRFSTDTYEFLDEYDEQEVALDNTQDIELLTYFYECISQFIFEKDFHDFLVCLKVKLGHEKVNYLLDKLVDINDERFRSFLHLLDNQFPNFQFEYLHLPTTLDRVRHFLLDRLKEEF